MKKKILLFDSLTILSVFFFQFKSFVIIVPRSFVSATVSITSPSSLISVLNCLFLEKLNMMFFVLEILSFIFLSAVHLLILFKWSCVFSLYRGKTEFCHQLVSFIKHKKNIELILSCHSHPIFVYIIINYAHAAVSNHLVSLSMISSSPSRSSLLLLPNT